ncbi:MAG: bis-aminopropyl spermidine synthase family protein [Candidatus Bathyarchaeia archaeon]
MSAPKETPPEDFLSELAGKMRLKEGEEAVRRILREIHRRGKVGTKDLARATRLPTPVAAAIRRELEKAGLVARKGGAVLTETGKEFVEGVLGMVADHRETEGSMGIPPVHEPILGKLRDYSSRRPSADPKLDQAHATPETALRRALYMLDGGSLAGRNVLFLGDDDLTSVAAGLLRVAKGITVVDIDGRLLEAITGISEEEGLGITCVLHDLREPLPEELRGAFDTFLTDPPYTLPGLELFLSRGIQALMWRKTSTAYLAYSDKPPLEMLEVHGAINWMGLYVDELIPRFNMYIGAEILGNTTSMFRLVVTGEARPVITGQFHGGIYTGELRRTTRVYRCRCGETIEVGSTKELTTIEELKTRGCPSCGMKEGFRLVERKRVN